MAYPSTEGEGMWKPFWFGLCTGMCSKSGLGHGFVGTVLSYCLAFA